VIDAALTNRPAAADTAIAEEVATANTAVAWELLMFGVLQRVRARRKLGRAVAPHPYQTFFVGYGFRDLSERLSVKPGHYVELKDATVADLRKILRSMRSSAKKRIEPKIASLQQLLKDMTPFAQQNWRITFQGYCDLLASGAAAPPARTTPEERSEVAKTRYQKMTPVQKKAAQQRRLLTRAENREAKKAGWMSDATAADQAERRTRDRDK